AGSAETTITPGQTEGAGVVGGTATSGSAQGGDVSSIVEGCSAPSGDGGDGGNGGIAAGLSVANGGDGGSGGDANCGSTDGGGNGNDADGAVHGDVTGGNATSVTTV